jgi:hypothetical protein
MSTRRRTRSRPPRGSGPLPALVAAGAIAAVLAAVALSIQGSAHTAYARRHPERADTVVTINRSAVGHTIPSGFVGLSVEYPALTWYTGNDPNAVNPAFEQLIRNLAPGQSPVLRIGGNSTDTTWVPTPGVPRPGGIGYSLSPRWLAIARALARGVNARMIMGIDLEAGVPPLAVAEARAFLSDLGSRAIRAFEIGNEAPRYGLFPWYHKGPGEPVLARPTSYDFDGFDGEFNTVARQLPGRVPTGGPTLGGPLWMENLDRFIKTAPHLGLVTFHEYPFNRCWIPVSSPVYPTVPRLLARSASRGFAPLVSGYLATAHRYGLPFRVDEINSVACGGRRGVSDTFASALWALDSLFELWRIGVSGVNVHVFPGATYILFSFRRSHGRWLGKIAPEYYGLLLFAAATPPGSRLLSVTTRGAPAVRAWATRGPRGTVRVVLINDDLHKRHVFLVRGPTGTATVIHLTAPSANATRGVRLGGESFGLTSTGRLSSPPEQEHVGPGRGRYVVGLAPATAAMLTIPAS